MQGREIKVIACEPSSCPSMTKGPYVYDFGDTAETTPLFAMHSLGHNFVPAPIHAGGLRYHGMAPVVSRLLVDSLIEARAYGQIETFAVGVTFARTEGFVPAPETNHAIACVIEEAKKAKEEGKENYSRILNSSQDFGSMNHKPSISRNKSGMTIVGQTSMILNLGFLFMLKF